MTVDRMKVIEALLAGRDRMTVVEVILQDSQGGWFPASIQTDP